MLTGGIHPCYSAINLTKYDPRKAGYCILISKSIQHKFGLEKDLSILIALLENEKSRLKKMIWACIEDLEGPDYAAASHHQKAINKTRRLIYTLRGLEEIKNTEIERYRRMLSDFEALVKSGEYEIMNPVLETKIQDIKEKLNSLDGEAATKSDHGILDNILSDLVSGKINKFKLFFNKSEDIYLLFTEQSGYICITTSEIDDEIIHSSDLKLLKAIGFKPIDKIKLELTIQPNRNILSELKSVLLKIVFEVFYFKHPASENFIELY